MSDTKPDVRNAPPLAAPFRSESPEGAHGHDHASCCHGHPHHAHDSHAHAQPPAAGQSLLSARNLSFKRGRRTILEGITLELARGEIVTVIGPNGAGKTTLVRLLLGLETPDQGTVTRAPGLVLGYAPQRFDLDPAVPMTVARFIALSRPAAPSEVTAALASVGAPALVNRQLVELSGGELQRVVLARALISKPDLLVLDEPVRGVDFMGEAELYTLIGQLRRDRGLGVLLVSHDLHVVMAQSDRVICLNRHICCSGVPHAVAQHPEYARLFGREAARALAIYHHDHDHSHDLTGAPQPAPVRAEAHSRSAQIK